MTYTASANRYESMTYRRCGKSGIKLPALSLGLWHNFGDDTPHSIKQTLCRTAFDQGITHFDLGNNYGPPAGSAESSFGKILKEDFVPYRDELLISTKAGYHMWDGPYGEWGSRKNLIASCDQSLKRLGVEYVDIFYSHRFDPETPLEETMGALDYIVRSGRALYAGISNYNVEQTNQAVAILHDLGTPCLIHQPRYSIFQRWVEEENLKGTLKELGVGSIAFSPLAQGMLTNRYLQGVPEDSRAAQSHFLSESSITPAVLNSIQKLGEIAQSRNQSLAQMAIAWVLRKEGITSALIGASKPQQILDCVGAIKNLAFTDEELMLIDQYAKQSGLI